MMERIKTLQNQSTTAMLMLVLLYPLMLTVPLPLFAGGFIVIALVNVCMLLRLFAHWSALLARP
jgi:hypothetical protein